MTAPAPASSPPSPRESDRPSVASYLLSFDWPQRDAAAEAGLVEGGLPLWLEILKLIPPAPPGGRLLELGSPPFHMTLLTKRFRSYQVTLSAGTTDGRARFRQDMASAAYGESHQFDCDCFDLERDAFPYPDEQFDVVLFCEVIEHLTENPVFVLREIHRVLKPGGLLVLSTPNAARSGNIMRLCLGVNVFDQYHLGAPLRGTRHSREYTMRELRLLVGGCGYRIASAIGRNLGQTQFVAATRPLEKVFRALSWLMPGVHSDHLFVAAVTDGPFRWTFPPEIFDQGHLLWYQRPCDSEIQMGRNDAPHTGAGWSPLTTGPDGMAQRRTGGRANACLRANRPAQQLLIEAIGTATLELQVVARGDAAAIGATTWRVAPEQWGVYTLLLSRLLEAGEVVDIEITAPTSVAIHRIALA